jgi:hypothetical protein
VPSSASRRVDSARRGSSPPMSARRALFLERERLAWNGSGGIVGPRRHRPAWGVLDAPLRGRATVRRARRRVIAARRAQLALSCNGPETGPKPRRDGCVPETSVFFFWFLATKRLSQIAARVALRISARRARSRRHRTRDTPL